MLSMNYGALVLSETPKVHIVSYHLHLLMKHFGHVLMRALKGVINWSRGEESDTTQKVKLPLDLIKENLPQGN